MKILTTMNAAYSLKVCAASCLAAVLLMTKTNAATPYVMSGGNYSESFGDITNWTNNFASGTGSAPWASVGIIGSGTSVTSGVRTTKSSATFVTGTAGGLQKGTGTILFLSTGSSATPEAVAADLLLDFTGRTAGTLSFDWAAIDNSSGTRPTSMRVFWSIDGTNFTEIAAAQVLDTASPTTGTIASVTLPASFDNSATARLRFYNHAGTNSTGSGSRDKFSIDNLTITSTSSTPTPEINVTGNAVNIVDGDITPSTADHTDFGSTVVGTPVVRTFTIQNTGTATLNISTIVLSGAGAGSFTLGTWPMTVVAAGSETFTVTYPAAAAGTATATVTINSDDADEAAYDFAITGTASAAPTPEIVVTGNSLSITDGDITPDVADHTDFGTVTIGGAPVTRTYTVTNSGTGTLTLATATVTGTGSAQFSVAAPLSTSLTAGQTTTFTVTYTPSGAAASHTATISFVNSDGDEDPFNFDVSGATAAPVVVWVNEIHYDNTGTDANEFVEVAGTAGTDLTGWTIVPYNGNGGASYSTTSLTGTIDNEGGTGFGAISVLIRGLQNGEPDGLALVNAGGTVVEFLSYEGSFTATNGPANGMTSVDIGLIEIDPGTLSTESLQRNNATPGTPGAWFGPATASAGTLNATPVLTPEINVTGNAANIVDGDITPSTADHTDFGSTVVGTPVMRTFTIQNNGTATLTISSIALSGAGAGSFTLGTLPTSVAAAGLETFTVTYPAAAAGTANATVTINSDDTDEAAYDFDITGTASAVPTPEIAVTGNSVPISDGDTTPDAADHTDFGIVTIGGAPVTRTYTVTNSGTGTLTLATATVTGSAQFSVDAPASTSLTAGQTTTFTVTYTPSGAAASHTATISFVNSDGDEDPFNFDVSGETAVLPVVWINEVHYDNTGTDTGEFVEVAGTAGVDLTGWTIVPYNGFDGTSYTPTGTLSGTIDNESGTGFGAVSVLISGLQNGAPDGLALVNAGGTVVEFLSYEGSFTATNGPALGLTSTDIGVSESSSTLTSESLQRNNSFPASPGAWSAPKTATPGSLNDAAVMPDGSGIATIANLTPGSALLNSTVFGRSLGMQTAAITLTGTFPGSTLTNVTIEVPAAITGLLVGNVSLSGAGSASVMGNTITITGAAVTTVTGLTVTISGLSTPDTSLDITNDGNYAFAVTTAESGGTPTAISLSPVAYVVIPITNIRDQDANGVPLDYNDKVAVQGVCTEEDFNSSVTVTSAYLQDGGNGVNIFSNSVDSPYVRGNEYVTLGNVIQFSGLTEVSFTATAGAVFDLGAATSPTPVTVTLATLMASPESYEGKLVTVAGLSRTSPTPAWATGVVIPLTDDGGTTILDIYIHTGSTATSEPFFPADITGVFGQFDTTSPYDGGYELFPRDPADINSSGLSPYQQWAQGAPYNLMGGDADFDADPDNDCVPNGIEFIVGGNPTVANDSNALLPQVSVAGTTPNRIATITFRTTAASDYLNPALQFSDDLIDWDLATVGPNVLSYVLDDITIPGVNLYTLQVNANDPKGFFRLFGEATP